MSNEIYGVADEVRERRITRVFWLAVFAGYLGIAYCIWRVVTG
jgi:hypothetical protein